MTFAAARALLESAIAARVCPAAVIEVGRREGPLWREAFGALTYDAGSAAATVETVFDLASLTKVISTTSLTMRAVGRGAIAFEAPLGDILPAWRSDDGRDIRIRHLLDHSSGLPAHARLWQEASGEDDYARAIRARPCAGAPGAAARYSDLGFILLGFALEAVTGARLDRQFAAFGAEIGVALGFTPSSADRMRAAPTEFDPWRGRLLVGEVHDENAAALGGVAGHAGLFGNVSDVGAFARVVLCTFDRPTALGTPDLMRRVAANTGVPGSSRALGWDTMRPTSSCGTRFSPGAIGHTGFTGTSLWIDETRNVYVALLTNRVHPTRADQRLPALRPRVHDAVVAALEDA